MIDLSGGKLQTGPEVLRFEEWIILKDFRLGHAGAEQVEHIFDPQAIVANAGAPSTLLRVKSNSAKIAHKKILLANGKQGEPVFRRQLFGFYSSAPRFSHARRLN